MVEHGGARFGAESVNDVHHTWRKPRIHEGANQIDRRQRCVFGWFDDASVATNEGREDLPRWNGHGKVPRCNHAHHSERNTHGHRELIGQFRGHGATVETASLTRHVKSGVDGLLYVAASLFEYLAHFALHVSGAIFFAF